MEFSESCRKCISSGKCDNDCCGIVLIPYSTYLKHKDKVLGIKIQVMEDDVVFDTPDCKCPFISKKNKSCMIYEDRPLVCRVYGLCDSLLCPYIKKNGRLRTPAGIRQTQRLINHDVENKLRKIERL